MWRMSWRFLFICFIGSIAFGANTLDRLPYNEDFENAEVELLVSYKLISRDHIAQKERYQVSHVMHYKGTQADSVKECEIDASAYAIMDDMAYFITSILKQEKEQVLECLYNHEVKVRESTQGRDNALSSKVSLEIPPTRIRARLHNKSIFLKILAKER